MPFLVTFVGVAARSDTAVYLMGLGVIFGMLHFLYPYHETERRAVGARAVRDRRGVPHLERRTLGGTCPFPIVSSYSLELFFLTTHPKV